MAFRDHREDAGRILDGAYRVLIRAQPAMSLTPFPLLASSDAACQPRGLRYMHEMSPALPEPNKNRPSTLGKGETVGREGCDAFAGIKCRGTCSALCKDRTWADAEDACRGCSRGASRARPIFADALTWFRILGSLDVRDLHNQGNPRLPGVRESDRQVHATPRLTW